MAVSCSSNDAAKMKRRNTCIFTLNGTNHNPCPCQHNRKPPHPHLAMVKRLLRQRGDGSALYQVLLARGCNLHDRERWLTHVSTVGIHGCSFAVCLPQETLQHDLERDFGEDFMHNVIAARLKTRPDLHPCLTSTDVDYRQRVMLTMVLVAKEEQHKLAKAYCAQKRRNKAAAAARKKQEPTRSTVLNVFEQSVRAFILTGEQRRVQQNHELGKHLLAVFRTMSKMFADAAASDNMKKSKKKRSRSPSQEANVSEDGDDPRPRQRCRTCQRYFLDGGEEEEEEVVV